MTETLDEGENFSSLLVEDSFHLVELRLGHSFFLEHLHLVFVFRDLGSVRQVSGRVPTIRIFLLDNFEDLVALVDVEIGDLERRD